MPADRPIDRKGASNAEPAVAQASPAARFLTGPVVVINVGLDGFAAELAAAGVNVQHVEWAPPAGGDPVLAELLAKLGS